MLAILVRYSKLAMVQLLVEVVAEKRVASYLLCGRDVAQVRLEVMWMLSGGLPDHMRREGGR